MMLPCSWRGTLIKHRRTWSVQWLPCKPWKVGELHCHVAPGALRALASWRSGPGLWQASIRGRNWLGSDLDIAIGRGTRTASSAVEAAAQAKGSVRQSSAKPTVSRCPEAWPADRVRQAFIDYFTQKHQHTFIASSPVVPLNDPTLLFANAGMNQFKAVFMGQLDPSSVLYGVKRVANSQKCIRAGGKHNDLDDVGRDCYHHTFFEMLGNWSFGDYFKMEAIDQAWELLTEVYGLNPEQLYASYFGGDQEMGLEPDLDAKRLWERYLPPSRVLPFDKKDNFWEMGSVGPCGPCSEIHYDRIGGRDAAAFVNRDDPDVVEIWNLVFMQFYRDGSGRLTLLPNKHIDTGMGLERLTSILQDKRSNYDTDLFAPLLEAIHAQVAGEPYRGLLGAADVHLRDMAYRVIVDHARTLTVAVADGAMPSNEGRGYVLRRILRRAVRYGRQMLGAPPGFFSKLVPIVVESLGQAFPELPAAAERVERVLRQEEDAFDRNVERGMQYFMQLKRELAVQGSQMVPGERAFVLHDSHGFPLDLTQQMAEESGLAVDVAGFELAMERQKERSRAALRQLQAFQQGVRPLELVAEHTASLEDKGIAVTDDALKYDWDIQPQAVIRAIFTEEGFIDSTEKVAGDILSIGVILDQTSFYAEAGGQVGDIGALKPSSGAQDFQVLNTQAFGGYVLHQGLFRSRGNHLHVEDRVTCAVDYANRRRVAPNHTLTHVLHWALREVLGEGVDQRGSLVTADRLRFDFSIDSVSTSQLQQIEALVQHSIASALPVGMQEVPLADAYRIKGLRAVSGEAYPDPARVVTVGTAPISDMLLAPFADQWTLQSVELCGGTHVANTADASAFVILEESAVAKGIRRIVAATGDVALEAQAKGKQMLEKLAELESSASPSEVAVSELSKAIDAALMAATLKVQCRDRLGVLRKQLKKKKQKSVNKQVQSAASAKVADAVVAAAAIGKGYCVVRLDGLDAKALGQAVQGAEATVAVLALAVAADGKIHCVAVVPAASQSSNAGADSWVRATLAKLGGRSGGKPARAQGSAPPADEKAIAEAMTESAAYWNGGT